MHGNVRRPPAVPSQIICERSYGKYFDLTWRRVDATASVKSSSKGRPSPGLLRLFYRTRPHKFMDRPHLQKTFFVVYWTGDSRALRTFSPPRKQPPPSQASFCPQMSTTAIITGGQVSGGANVRAFVVDAGARVRVSISEKRLWFAF